MFSLVIIVVGIFGCNYEDNNSAEVDENLGLEEFENNNQATLVKLPYKTNAQGFTDETRENATIIVHISEIDCDDYFTFINKTSDTDLFLDEASPEILYLYRNISDLDLEVLFKKMKSGKHSTFMFQGAYFSVDIDEDNNITEFSTKLGSQISDSLYHLKP